MIMQKFVMPVVAFLAMLAVFAVGSAWAGQPYDAKSFAQAQAAGKPILVDVFAPWCPTCAKQKPILEGIERSRPDLVVFQVDFDGDKAALKQFRVQYQSTLIVFKGMSEVGRSTGDTNPDSIGALIAKAGM
jgi:thiol-disulfide isomerase/thioredoxin